MALDSNTQVSLSDSTIIRIIDTIKKGASDPWNYRGLELSNGMLVVLISDLNIDKGGAALDINIGSLADPKDVCGTAHFLEHMLFMGSSKYPGENEYSRLINENGGFSNAFTTDDHTNYYFDINPNLLSDALDVFAQFFISPLFAVSSTDRELEAVNSEYEGNLFQDSWRISQIEKSTSDPKHPYSRFSIGNIESLKIIPKQNGIDIRQVLLDFHKNEYSANRMSLAVLGNQTLDQLQSLVVRSFKDVPNKNLEMQKYPSDPYGEKKRKTICYIVPVEEKRCLTFDWVIPDYRELYYCDPRSYVLHLLGHEGDGSILSYLKKIGLASELAAGRKNGALGFNFCSIDIELTIEGLERWKQVIYIVYQYMAMLIKEGPKEWIFKECKNLNTMHFQFEDKERPDDFVSNLAGHIRDFPLTECLSGPYELREFWPDLIIDLLENYLIPSKMRIFLVSKTFKSIATEKEKWFGTQYKQEYLPEELIQKCETCELISELHLPLPNDFIPTDFHLYSQEKNLARPQLPTKIKENEFYRLYYAEDSFYKLPKVYLYFELRNPLGNIDPTHANMNTLYVALIQDSLTEFVYSAQLGELEYELIPLYYAIQLKIYGFNHKTQILLEKIIDRMINIKIDTKRFKTMKEKIKRLLQNFRRDVPYQMAADGITYLTAEYQWNSDELLSCIDDITVQDLEAFIPRILTRFYIDSLMYGNLTKDQAIEYMTMIQNKFQEKYFYQPLFSSMWFDHRELILPDGCNYAYTMLNDAHQLNAIEIYFQCFEQTLENNSLLELFSHLVNEPCFDQLRTKEQLGYIVDSDVRRSRGIQGFRIIVQSSRELDYVNQRIESFIDLMRDYISTMSDELFEKQREGYMIKKVEIPKKMQSQAYMFWDEITNHQFCFDRPQLEVNIIKTLERKDLLRFYDYYISPHSIHRRKLALHVNPSSLAIQTAANEVNVDESEDISDDEELSSIAVDVTGTTEINHETINLIEQPLIVDTFTETDSKHSEKISTQKEINLPKAEWIDNIHEWKSKLACYPLAQSYENIDIPVIYKL